MTEGRCKSEWNHTASIMAIIAEVNRNRKKRARPYQPSDFHPYMPKQRRGQRISVEQLSREMMGLVDQMTNKKRKRTGKNGR